MRFIRSEKRIARNEPITTNPLSLNSSRLEWIEYYKQEEFYSRSENRPPNINCPHWRKYALNESNEEPPISPTSIDNNTPSPASNSYSAPVSSVNENTSSGSNSSETPNQQNTNLNPKIDKPTSEEIQLDYTSADNLPSNSAEMPKSSSKKLSLASSPPTSPKPGLNAGIIAFIAIAAAFSVISLGYLIWNKIVKK